MPKVNFLETRLTYRETPWDSLSFNRSTIEILEINSPSGEIQREVLSRLEDQLAVDTLVYFRADANNEAIKRAMLQAGYYIAETSFLMKLNRLHKIDCKKVYRNDLELNSEVDQVDIEQISQIAYDSFNYSRFHEDPFIPEEQSRVRYRNWIYDLAKQNKGVLTYKDENDNIISFMFYDETEGVIDLILGGSRNGSGMMTPYFWSSILTHFQKQGFKKVSVGISAANISILNLYYQFGFKVLETRYDYHKSTKGITTKSV